jgi:DUF1009 family protein
VAEKKLALVAGNGIFPVLVARGAKAAGVEVVAVAHRDETDPAIEDEVAEVVWVRVGELGRTIRIFVDAGCDHAVMAGGIGKVRALGAVRPDLRGAALLLKTRTLKDDRLLRGIADELRKDGLPVVPSTRYLPELIPQPGPLTRKAPGRAASEDIALGRRVLAATASFEIGQSVVVKEGLVYALEAVEGTDAAIRRGAEAARGGAIVVKAAKPEQDLRFDVPAIGPDTIALMQEVGASVLAIEAGRTIVLERPAVVAAAEAAGIRVFAFDPEEKP